MKLQEKCLPCIVNQALKVADLVGLQEKEHLLKRVFRYLSEVDYQTVSSPELIGDIFALIKEETKNPDPYRETRRKYNQLFLEKIEQMEQEINTSSDAFSQAIKYAIIGNIIDFNPIHELTIQDVLGYFERLKTESFGIDDSQKLKEDLMKSKRILYLGDNCGEICLDLLLVKKIKEMNPKSEIYFATRGTAVVNDSIEEDAYFVGMDRYATVISNGDSSLGTVLRRTSTEFQKIYHSADVILSKGQANYECLSEQEGNIYFLLMTKCAVIAEDIQAPEMKMIVKKM